MEGVWCLRFDGHKLVSGGGDRSVKVWDLKDSVARQHPPGAHGTLTMPLTSTTKQAATGSSDQTIRDMGFLRYLVEEQQPKPPSLPLLLPHATCLLQ